MHLPYRKTITNIYFKKYIWRGKKKSFYHDEVTLSQIKFPSKDTDFCLLNLMLIDNFAHGASHHWWLNTCFHWRTTKNHLLENMAQYSPVSRWQFSSFKNAEDEGRNAAFLTVKYYWVHKLDFSLTPVICNSICMKAEISLLLSWKYLMIIFYYWPFSQT